MQSKKNILSISNNTELQPYLSLFEVLNEVKQICGVDYLVVGATARDIVLRDVYGLEPERATRDVDFSINVSSWDDFDNFINEFVQRGGVSGRTKHRFNFIEGSFETPVDIVPFGDIASVDNSIEWPPNFDTKMSVLGFSEAYANALNIEIAEDLIIKVTSLPGLCLLKMIAWLDRPSDLRSKDAKDVKNIFRRYEKTVVDRLYEDETLGARYDFNQTHMAVDLLANDVFELASVASRQFINEGLLQNEDQQEYFIREMGAAGNVIEKDANLMQIFVDTFERAAKDRK